MSEVQLLELAENEDGDPEERRLAYGDVILLRAPAQKEYRVIRPVMRLENLFDAPGGLASQLQAAKSRKGEMKVWVRELLGFTHPPFFRTEPPPGHYPVHGWMLEPEDEQGWDIEVEHEGCFAYFISHFA